MDEYPGHYVDRTEDGDVRKRITAQGAANTVMWVIRDALLTAWDTNPEAPEDDIDEYLVIVSVMLRMLPSQSSRAAKLS